jgi:hypothetical protein
MEARTLLAMITMRVTIVVFMVLMAVRRVQAWFVVMVESSKRMGLKSWSDGEVLAEITVVAR